MGKSKIKRYRWCFYHLILSVGFFGLFTVYLVGLPFLLLAPFSFRAWKFSSKIIVPGVSILRWSQPWWRGDIQVDLPQEVRELKSGCLCVSNHRSHIDVFVLLEKLPSVRILTKNLIFWVPGLGGAAWLFRMIKVKRGNESSFWKAMDKIEQALKEKDIVLVFPEMTRSPFAETELQRFTIAPFQKAMITGVPVIPIVIWGSDYLWPKGEFKIALKGPLIVKSLPPVDPVGFESASELSNHVKSLIQNEINRLSQQHPYGNVS